MTGATLRRRFVALTALRWLPTGLTVPALILIGQARGLSLGQIGLITAIYSTTTLLLELPTGGLSDVVGRRPVLVVAASMSVIAGVVTAFGTSFAVLAAAAALRGVARALDSGPLQSWYVDRLHEVAPGAPIRSGLSKAGAAESVALAVGTLGAGGVLALTDLPSSDAPLIALSTPFLVSAGFACVQAALVVLWVTEPKQQTPLAIRSLVADVPATIARGARLATTHATLRRLLIVVAVVGVALVGIELLTPPHLAHITGSNSAGASTYAVLATLGFVGSALGAAMAPLAARLLHSPSRAALLGGLGGAIARAATAASALPALATAYVAFYVLMGVGSPLLNKLTHDAVTSRERATMLSVNSMAMQGAGIVAALTLGPLAEVTALALALAVPAVVLAAGTLALVRMPTPIKP